MQVSNDLMVAMGFRQFTENEVLVASFTSITVYEVRGVVIAPGSTELSCSTVGDVKYRLAVCENVNDGCQALVNDTFVENVDDWKKKNNCLGPFVLVQLGPTVDQTCSSGHIQVADDGTITTYDCFPRVRGELDHLESMALPAIVSALTCVLNEESKYVALRKIERASAGRCGNGAVVHDMRLQFRGELHTSYNLSQSGLQEKLDAAVTLASTINPKSSRFFALGLAEEDQLKRFLYFFLSLEIETNAVFELIDRSAGPKRLIGSPSLNTQSMAQQLNAQVAGLKGLYCRFVWCAACTWINLDESDLLQFKKLKDARNAIAHGSASEPPNGFAKKAELLAHKILSNTRGDAGR